ncbi:MAG: hypothetical protein ACO36I_15175 [Candidatus Latescibacterota bacterium]|jgi:hypothetical protein
MKHIYLSILLLCMACEGLPSEPDGLRALANKMETQKDTYDKAYDNWSAGDVTSTFTSYLDGHTVAFIEEHMTRGTSGRSINRYYFYNNEIFCYRENRNNSDSTRVEIEILFDIQGEVMAAQQTQDRQPVSVDRYIIPMAKKHGQTLRERTKDAPVMQDR